MEASATNGNLHDPFVGLKSQTWPMVLCGDNRGDSFDGIGLEVQGTSPVDNAGASAEEPSAAEHDPERNDGSLRLEVPDIGPFGSSQRSH
jgi:hypothetical protein